MRQYQQLPLSSSNSFEKFVRVFQDDVFRPSVFNIQGLVEIVAQKCQEEFGASLVTVWANNHSSRHLVYLASFPPSDVHFVCTAVKPENAITGRCIQQTDIVLNDDLVSPNDGRLFCNPDLITVFSTTALLSIPIFSSYDRQLVHFVVNLSFCKDNIPDMAAIRPQLTWLQHEMGQFTDQLLFKINHNIRYIANRHIPSVSGIAGLIRKMMSDICAFTQSSDVIFYNWRKEKRTLSILEATLSSHLQTSLMQENASEENEWIFSQCVENKKPFMIYNPRLQDQRPTIDRIHSLQFNDMAVSVESSHGNILGVLRCQRRQGKANDHSFASHDLHILEQFAAAIAPTMERYAHAHAPSLLTGVMEYMSATVASTPKDLDAILNGAISSFVNAIHAKHGSIYIIEDDDGKDILRIRAATESLKHGIKQRWSYAIGEGLTGDIASDGGKVLSYRTLEDRKKNPAYNDKYGTEEIGTVADQPKPFFGLPIYFHNKVIGIWKVEGLEPSEEHQEQYFTDRDVQVAKMLTSFLAYIISSHQSNSLFWDKFQKLADSCVEIEKSQNEQQAIDVVMDALNNIGWKNAMLSLYNEHSNEIVGYKAVGETWEKVIHFTRRHISSNDVLAVILRKNEPEFIPDSREDERCDPRAVTLANRIAQYVIPLRLVSDRVDEMIGTLQVDMGEALNIAHDDKLALDAFADHLAIAISRFRNVNKFQTLTNHLIENGRYVAMKTLAGNRLHHLKGEIDAISSHIHQASGTELARDNPTAARWLEVAHEKVKQLYTELVDVLDIVRTDAARMRGTEVKIGNALHNWYSLWYNFSQQRGCLLRRPDDDIDSSCYIAESAFSEILAVLLNNSVQANASSIEVTVQKIPKLTLPISGQVIRNVCCIIFADDGEGLDAEVPDTIFGWGYTTKLQEGGTGLGLPTARMLARDAGGDIWYLGPRSTYDNLPQALASFASKRSETSASGHSRIGTHKGSVFCLALPIYQALPEYLKRTRTQL